ncbi:hypothetical protein Q427_17090 [Halomonas sp. BC04]|nr:hypothetical protein Q427_17090 [Halomonas sp. BC04]
MNTRLWHASRDEVIARAGQLRALIDAEQECQFGQLIHSDLGPYIDKILGLAEFIVLDVDGECQGFCAFYTYDESQDSAFITLIILSPILRSSGWQKRCLSMSSRRPGHMVHERDPVGQPSQRQGYSVLPSVGLSSFAE